MIEYFFEANSLWMPEGKVIRSLYRALGIYNFVKNPTQGCIVYNQVCIQKSLDNN